MQKSIGKSKIRPPVKSLKIRFQFQTWHTWLRRGHYPSCNFWIESVQWGLPQSRGNITLLWLFVYCPFFLDPAPRSNRCADSYAEWLKWHVSAQGRSFWGSGRWVTSYGEKFPNNSSKRGLNRQFQAKAPKSINRNICGTSNPTN